MKDKGKLLDEAITKCDRVLAILRMLEESVKKRS